MQKDSLILRYPPIVRKTAVQLWGMARSPLQEEDLVDQGVIVLMEYSERYDEFRGAKFETYALLRVWGTMIDYTRSRDQVLHRVHNFQKKADEACIMVSNGRVREADTQGVADYLDISAEKVENHIQYTNHVAVLSSENVPQGTTGLAVKGELEAENVSTKPEEGLFYKELREQLTVAIDSLGEKERSVISPYYHEESEYLEITEILGIGQPRMRQIHTRVIGRLKANMEGCTKRQKWLILPGLHTIVSGMMINQRELNVAANNLTNVKTSGYRSKRPMKTTFDETFVRQINGQSTAIGSGSTIILAGAEMASHKQGEIQDTGKTYDLTIGGDGYFVTQGENGTYLTGNGRFFTGGGDDSILPGVGMVMGDGDPVYADEDGSNVGKDGIVYDDEGNELDQVRIMNPDGVNAFILNENGIYSVGARDNLTQVYPSVYQGKPEKSNVDLNMEMTRTMEIRRAFQFYVRALVTLDQINQKSVSDTGKLQEDIQMNTPYYTGVSAMRVFQDELGVVVSNVANVNTTGYKPQKSSFGNLLYTQMDTRSVNPLVGHGIRNIGVEPTFVQSSFKQTGCELDFATSGKAYFAAEVNERNEEPAYTRDGPFMISVMDDGNCLVTRDGYHMLGPKGERVELEYKTTEDENGKEEETAELDLNNLKEQIDLYSYENPDDPTSVGGNLPRLGETLGRWVSQADMGDDVVISKILPKTPRHPTTMASTEMINLTEVQRAFQLSSRVVSAIDEMENIINILR